MATELRWQVLLIGKFFYLIRLHFQQPQLIKKPEPGVQTQSPGPVPDRSIYGFVVIFLVCQSKSCLAVVKSLELYWLREGGRLAY
jgi:hypothetical protein